MCECCRKIKASTKISFTNGSGGKFCDKCRDEIFEQYKSMGKPGQIIIHKV